MGAPVPGDQVESDLAKKSEVARSRPVAHAAVILTEGDVQHPMQRVLNAPMPADRPDQDSGIIIAACQEIADLGLAGERALGRLWARYGAALSQPGG